MLICANLCRTFLSVTYVISFMQHTRGWYEKTDLFKKYGYFSEAERLNMLSEARHMFNFGYDNYMKYAFPYDELNPIDCEGRGPDVENPDNININDILGDYSLTLVDTLDTLAVMGNVSEFKRAVKLVVENVDFNTNSTIQVFEANIRLLGGLLSAHLLIIDPSQPFGELRPTGYDDELLTMAHDLASRLIAAFEESDTGLPHPRVHLSHGIRDEELIINHNLTCLAGAGSLLLEFGLLSRLVKDPVFESAARRANKALWSLRSNITGLFGNVINIQTGEWVNPQSGVGAGQDSFFEYLFKSYILFGEDEDHKMFNESYADIKQHMRRGRDHCNSGTGNHPLYVNVNMNDGSTFNTWIDSLQAAFTGIQVLAGDIEEAICSHAVYYSIWRKYGVLPERYNWKAAAPEVKFYPLRPELIESTYLLYRATRNPFYLHVGKDILDNINKYAKAECGYATIHSVDDMSLEDRMESFFLSETCKYLFLLFDEHNPVNTVGWRYLFTTEGHVIPITSRLRRRVRLHIDDDTAETQRQSRVHHTSGSDGGRMRGSEGDVDISESSDHHHSSTPPPESPHVITTLLNHHTPPANSSASYYSGCESIAGSRSWQLPLKPVYFQQLDLAIGILDD